MTRSYRMAGLRIGVSLAALLATAACATTSTAFQAIAPMPSATQGIAVNPQVGFAHTISDLPVDPAARFGRLPNGMGYVLYRNGTPPGAASVWMRVGAGSIMEHEGQRGLAHFIEHMAFQGSTRVPEGEMLRLLQRDGLRFGADTNASTSFFETVYNLNLPVASNRIVDQALFLMRETAGNISFDPAAIDRERGVVLSEERASSTVGMRASTAEMGALFAGAKYPERMPIGLVDVLRTAQRPSFVQFYNDFYRPEYTTLIVAGDVDLDRVEAVIREKFSDWRPGPLSSAASTNYGAVAPRTKPEAKVFVAEGLMDAISLSWVGPAPSDAFETRATSFDEMMFGIATAILNQRYGLQANTPNAAFTQAGFQKEDIPHTATVLALNILPKPGLDRVAFAQAMETLREYLANGPTQEELDRILIVADQVYRERAAAAGTMPTQEVARRVLETLGSHRVLQSPAQSMAEFQAWKPRITVAAVKAVLQQVDVGKPPLIWRQGQQAASFDQTAMLEAFQTALHAPVGGYEDRQTVAWPYTQFGMPTEVVSRVTLPGVGATKIIFANGVVLTVKPTTFEDNAVYVALQVGNGLMGIRPDQGPALFMARQVGVGAGGLGRISADDTNQALTGRAYGLDFAIGENATTLSGSTTTTDLPVQMQVLAAYMTDSAFRPDALERVKTRLPSSYDLNRTSPDGVYALMGRGDLYSRDARFAATSQQDALAVENAAIATLIKDQFGHGPVEVTMVGDITVEKAIAETATTFGALPNLPSASGLPSASQLRFPTMNLHRVYTHAGRIDQNLSVIAWPTTDASDPRRAAGLDLLAAVMTARELEEVREKEGATYAVSANSNVSDHFPNFGFIITRAAVRPEMDEVFYEAVSGIVAELKQRPVTADELIRARQPMIDSLRNARNSNGYWLSLLSGTLRDPDQIASNDARERDLQSITAAEIQALAETYLDMSKALRIQVKPRNSVEK